MLRLTLATSLLVSACVTKQQKTEYKEPPPSHNSFIVTEMKKHHVEAGQSAIGTGIYKDLLSKNQPKEAMKMAKQAKSFGSQFAPPIDNYINLFLKEDAKFACNEKKKVLYCDVSNKSGHHLIKMRLVGKHHSMLDFIFGGASGDYAMHFCNASSSIMIPKNDSNFWNTVMNAQHSTKDEIYKNAESVPLNGVVLVLESGNHGIIVTDFRASIGDVTPNSAEYKEFVDSNCLNYAPSEKHEM